MFLSVILVQDFLYLQMNPGWPGLLNLIDFVQYNSYFVVQISVTIVKMSLSSSQPLKYNLFLYDSELI